MTKKTQAFLEGIEQGVSFSRSLLCPAKINLFLEVTGKREDGYHTIESVMQKVALCDKVDLTLSKGEGTVITSNERALPTGEKNIAYKAIAAYLAAAGLTLHADLYIHKRIPLSAGLAGGSTDAAGVLKALDAMIGALSREKLAEIALSLGADVPFCLFRTASLCRGLGEEMSFVTPLADCHLVIAKSRRESVSTKDAYALIDSLSYLRCTVSGMTKALEEKNLSLIAGEMMNRFEEVILPLRPSVKMLKETMLSCGAIRAMMSGSGPSVFGIFEREEDALRARELLRQEKCFVFLSRPWR